MTMRASILLLLVAACTSHTAPGVDRTGCNDCHATEYDTAATAISACQPTDHVALGYPRTCSNCHGTTAWCPADAMHTKFDITSDSHAGWDCADCHTSITYNPPHIDEKPIFCIGCHFHDKPRTDSIHLGKGGYTYTGDSCLMCHLESRQ
jgi:nitrate/TMAO reductase-like tetraheme cytochrome c subunit